MSLAATWIQLEVIILSEVSQKEKDKYYTIMWHNYLCNKTDSQTQRADVVVKGVGGRDGLGVWDQQMQTITCKMKKQQGPTVQHRELYSVSWNKP